MVATTSAPQPDDGVGRVRIYSAVGMLLSGFGMSVAGFVVPPLGQIDDSVLMYTAQALVYAGTALGLDVFIDSKIRKIKGN